MQRNLPNTSFNSPMMLRGNIRSCALRISLSCICAPLVRSSHDGAKRTMIITGFPTLGILLTLSAGPTYPPTSDSAGFFPLDHLPVGQHGSLARPAGLRCSLLLKHGTCIKQSSVLGQYIQKRETNVSVNHSNFEHGDHYPSIDASSINTCDST